jgi:rhodanese-related sulfurtransferase|uniref:rhodanese-like domain-containing protein n=1 Tax=Candidatus Planktophila sp. TaxID=2175601 RepID=UPI00404A2739
MKKVIAILASVLLLAGCSTSSTAMDLSVSEFSSKVTEAGIITLDVRTPSEFNEGHIEGASLIDFQSGNFENEIASLDKNQTYAIYCRSGNRSGEAVKVMTEAGFTKIYNLDGGVIDWARAGLPLVK